MPEIYDIEETHCFPCSWKLKSTTFKDDNHTWRYCKTIQEAKEKIEKYHGKVGKIIPLTLPKWQENTCSVLQSE
jgi:hypothetical protein